MRLFTKCIRQSARERRPSHIRASRWRLLARTSGLFFMMNAGRRTPTRMLNRWLSLAALALGVVMLSLGAAGGVGAAVGEVRVLHVEGVINPVSARYIVRGIEDAAAEGDAAVLIELDTPGGLRHAPPDLTRAMP